jgi:hypothetical protein
VVRAFLFSGLLLAAFGMTAQGQSVWESDLQSWWAAPEKAAPEAPICVPTVTRPPFLTVADDACYNVRLQIDGLILGRSGLDASVLAVDQNGDTVLDSADMQLDPQIGPRVSFLLGGRQTGLEFSFFGINDISFFGQFDQPGITPIFFNAVPADPLDSYDIHFLSRLNSAELMFWHGPIPRARFGIGVRGVGLAETYDVLDSAQTTSGFFSSTNNDIVGLQLGTGLGLLRSQRFDIDATIKTGVYYHGAEIDAISENFTLHVDDDEVTNVTELDVGGMWHFGRHFAIRGGYFILWLFDAASALDQSDDWRIVTGQGSFDYSTVIFQGGYFGIEARW